VIRGRGKFTRRKIKLNKFIIHGPKSSRKGLFYFREKVVGEHIFYENWILAKLFFVIL